VPKAAADGYTTIHPDVSTNTPPKAMLRPASVDPNEDVMASILAIPPGR
jgi:hypothetical protein